MGKKRYIDESTTGSLSTQTIPENQNIDKSLFIDPNDIPTLSRNIPGNAVTEEKDKSLFIDPNDIPLLSKNISSKQEPEKSATGYPLDIHKKGQIQSELDDVNIRIKNLEYLVDKTSDDFKKGLGNPKQLEKQINDYNKEILKLEQKRKELTTKIKPVTGKEKDDALKGIALFGDAKESDLRDKYGNDRFEKIRREVTGQYIQNIEDTRLDDSPNSLLTYRNYEKIVNKQQVKSTEEKFPNILKEIENDHEFISGNSDKKKKVIESKINKYVATLKDVSDKDKLRKKIYNSVLSDLMKDKDGNPTYFAIKLYTKDLINQLEDYKDLLLSSDFKDFITPDKEQITSLLGPKASMMSGFIAQKDQRGNNDELKISLDKLYGSNNSAKAITDYKLELRNTLLAIRELQRIMDMPESKKNAVGSIKDIGKGVASNKFEDYLLMIPDMMRALNVSMVLNKVKNNKELTFSEQKTMEAMATLNAANQFKTKSILYQSGKMAALMIPYAAAFVLTGGVYSAAKAGTAAGLKSLIGPASEKLLPRYTIGITSRLVGTAAQTLANPQMIIKNVAQNMTPQANLRFADNKFLAEIDKNTGDNFGKALAKGSYTAFTELLFERSGTHLFKGLKAPFGFIGKKVGLSKLIKLNILSSWMEQRGIKNITEAIAKVKLKNLGWDGIIEEYLEEVGTDIANIPASGSPFKPGWLNQQIVTITSIGLFGGIPGAYRLGYSTFIGDHVKFAMGDKGKNGKRKIVKLPIDLWNEYTDKVLNSNPNEMFVDEKAFEKFVEEHKDELSDDQEKLLVGLIMNEGKKRGKKFAEAKAGAEDILNRTANKESKKTTTKTSEQEKPAEGAKIAPKEQISEEDQKKINQETQEAKSEITKEEKTEIDLKNEEIINTYPELYKLGLIPEDEASGQLIEPSTAYLEEVYDTLSKRYSQQVETDQSGNIINDTPELMTLRDMLNVLNNEITKAKTGELELSKFYELPVESKFQVLKAKLQRGDKIKGKLTASNTDYFGRHVILDLGEENTGVSYVENGKKKKFKAKRTVKVFLNPDIERKTVDQAILDNKDATLKLTPWQQWNPNLSIKNQYGKPYRDRIDVIVDGKVIGHVQVTDFKKEEAKQKKIEEEKKKVSKRKQKAADKKINGIVSKALKDINSENNEGENNKPNDHRLPLSDKTEHVGLRESQRRWKEHYNFLENLLSAYNIKKNKHYSLSTILEKLIQSNDKVTYGFYRMFKDLLLMTNADIVFLDSLQSIGSNAVGLFDMNENTIYFGLQNAAVYYADHPNIDNAVMINYILLHETTHAYTSLLIAKWTGELNRISPLSGLVELTEEQSAILEDIDLLYNHVKNVLGATNEEYYGLKNIQEFVAEGLNNPRFIKALAQIEVDPVEYSAPNALVAFYRYILRLLGIDNRMPSAYENLIKLVSALGQTYDAEMIDRFTRETQYAKGNLDIILPLGYEDSRLYLNDKDIPDQINENNKKQFAKSLVMQILNTDWGDITVSEIIPAIIKSINNSSSLSVNDKKIAKEIILRNQEKIQKVIVSRIIKSSGKGKKIDEIKIEDLDIPDISSVTMTSDEKIDSIRRIFHEMWKALADHLGVNVNTVERKFLALSKSEQMIKATRNKDTFNKYLDSLVGDDIMTNNIVAVLRRSKLSAAISLINFYHKLHVVKNYSLIITPTQNGRNVDLRLTNSSNRYSDFIDRFWIKLMSYYDPVTSKKGIEGMKSRISRYQDDYKKRFHIENNSWAWYESQAPEKREELRREQFESDLSVLSDLTGIDSRIWREYFKSQTNETMASPKKTDKGQKDYGTYEELLKHDTFRSGYHRVQSNIAFNLMLTLRKKENQKYRYATLDEFKDNIITYFTKGDVEKNVFSNIYKLVTAIEDSSELSFNGRDVKGNQFGALMQASNIITIAHEILKDKRVDNPIVKFYQELGKNAEIVQVNGVLNIAERGMNGGVNAKNMSNYDLWLLQFFMFYNNKASYYHWLGQFSDKLSLNFIEVKKHLNITEDMYDALEEKFPDFEFAVDDFIKNYLNDIVGYMPDRFKGLGLNQTNQMKRLMAREFLYNFAVNIEASNNLFFGNMESYNNDFITMVKRAGSSNSPGYLLNPYIEGGVGEEYTYALVNDEFNNIKTVLGDSWEAFDGIEFMLGDYAARTRISMGSIFSKEEVPDMDILDSIKCLTSLVDQDNNLRGLTKTNRINIDLLADVTDNSMFKTIRDFMYKNKINILSFTSGTKAFEKITGKQNSAINLWDENGNALKNPVIPENGIIVRKTKDVYVQQDLRHTPYPVTAKSPSQIISVFKGLHNGNEIINDIVTLQKLMISELYAEISESDLIEKKIEWIKKNISEKTNADLVRMLDQRISINDPIFVNYIHAIIASEITKRTLQIPVNRLVTQEIPDVDEFLGEMRIEEWKGEKHVIVSDIAANVKGARYENDAFKGNPLKAIAYVKKYKESHLDLFDPDTGELMEWEIYLRDGIIPGEIHISTRVPTDDFHSITVGRLKKKLPYGNFTMLSRGEHEKSGSDFDGDQRFNQALYKSKGRVVLNSNTQKGLSNKIMLKAYKGYTDPSMFDYINRPINTNANKNIINRHRQQPEFTNQHDYRSYNIARLNNSSGVKQKGMMTDANTIYGLLADMGVNFNSGYSFTIGDIKIELTGFSADPKKYLKEIMFNHLNMAFDNAKDPKNEGINFNEVTNNMYVLALLGDRNLNSNNKKVVLTHYENVIKFFTQPLVRDFVKYSRHLMNSGFIRPDINNVKLNLYSDGYNKSEVDSLIRFFKASNELADLRTFFSLSQKAIISPSEFISALELYRDVISNSKRFKLIDTRAFINPSTHKLKGIFEIIGETLKLQNDISFNNDPLISKFGKTIQEYILNRTKSLTERTRLNIKDRRKIDYLLRLTLVAKSLQFDKPFKDVENVLVKTLDRLKTEYPDNEFLRIIEKVYYKPRKEYGFKGAYRIEINPDYRFVNIGDDKLNRIRGDFNLLWNDEKGRGRKIAEYLIMNTIYRFGISMSTANGGYLSLTSDDFRAFLSQEYDKQLKRLLLDDVSSIEKFRIYQAVKRGYFEIKPKGQYIYHNYFLDYAPIPGLWSNITEEDIEDIDEVEEPQRFTWARTSDNGYEVSSKGDKRFSALYARLKDGRTIEEAYQLDIKGYRGKVKSWKEAKGKPPIRKISKEQTWEEYKNLWRTYISENPGLLEDLRAKAEGKVLTDVFASTDVSQARALAEILNESSQAAKNIPEVKTGSKIYQELGNKTETGNVKIIKDIFEHKTDKNIITAFRVDKNLGLLESFRRYNAIGNPINWQNYKPRFEGDNATIAFIDWFLGRDFTDIEQEYRQALLSSLDKLKGLPIEYYKELNRPSHATALDYLINKYNITPKESSNTTDELNDKIKKYFNAELKSSAKLFPPLNHPDIDSPKEMIGDDAASELLATDDPELQKAVYDHLHQAYPDVIIFRSREAFLEFAAKRGGSLFNVSPISIGMAFQNAVFLDPNKAVQSTIFHEFAHIYWDALPEDHEIKQKLFDLYSNEYPDKSKDDIEEEIILDIGRAGTDIAKVRLKGNAFNKFLDLLKQFWISVKQFFGKYSKADLVYQMASNIYKNKESIRPSSFETEALIKSMILPEERNIPEFNGDTHVYRIGDIPLSSVTTIVNSMVNEEFNPLVATKAAISKINRLFFKLTKRSMTKEEKESEKTNIYKSFVGEYADRGTMFHTIAEIYFNDGIVPDEIIQQFAPDVYRRFITSLKNLKNQILQLYPYATFYTERKLADLDNEYAGTADLIVDIGGNQIFLIDFKVKDKEIADDQLDPLPHYKKAYGMFKPPFSNLPNSNFNHHVLQLNMYANMIENITKDSEEKNEVVRLRIIPFIVNKNNEGKIVSAYVGNWVKIPRSPAIKSLANEFVKVHKNFNESLNIKYPEYNENLKKAGAMARLRQDMLAAIHFLNLYSGGLSKIKKHHIGAIRKSGIYALKQKFLSSTEVGGLGYELNDLNNMTSEEFFYVTINNITRDEYYGKTEVVEYIDEKGNKKKKLEHKKGIKEIKFVEQPIYEFLNPIPYEKSKATKYMRINGKIVTKVNPRDNLDQGAQYIAIHSIKREQGKIRHFLTYYDYVDGKYRLNKVEGTYGGTVKMQDEFGNDIKIYPDNFIASMYKVVNPESVKKEEIGNFSPTHIFETEEHKEFHWKFDQNESEMFENNIDAAKKYLRERQIRQIWNFFNQYNKYSEFNKLTSDIDLLIDMYTKLSAFDDDISNDLTIFLREEIMNNLMAEAIRNELAEETGTPKTILPSILNIYYMLIDPERAVWKDFDRGRLLRLFQQPRTIEGQYVPLSFMLSSMRVAYRKFLVEQFDLNNKLKDFIGKIDFDSVTTIVNDERYYIKYNRFKKGTLEREFLETIYEYYRKYDPEYLENQKFVPGIRVSSVYMTLPEFNSRYGNKHGRMLHTLLKPATYDNARMPLVIGFDDNGKEIYAKDQDGLKIIMTLREIKERFMMAMEDMNPDERDNYLSKLNPKPIRFNMLRIPGTPNIVGWRNKAGLLAYHVNKAKRIESTGYRDEYNTTASLKMQKRTIPVIGRNQKQLFESKEFVEAESKAISSLIYRHYMKRFIAPYEWMKQNYTDGINGGKIEIAKYLEQYVETVLFHETPDSIIKSKAWTKFLMMANSLNKIIFSPRTTFNNFAIGQAMDLMREPQAYIKGLSRILSSPDPQQIMKNLRKAYNILQRYALANIVNDTLFDELDNKIKLLGVDLQKAEAIGYAFMEYAEKANQFPIFIGLMTDEEWNAYDFDGSIIDPKAMKHLTSLRVDLLATRVMDIHGDYSQINAAPFWLSNLGAMIMQFRKWVPAMIWAHIAPYHLDQHFNVRSGLLPTLDLLHKWIIWNNKVKKGKADALYAKMKEHAQSQKNITPFFQTTSEYLTQLIEEANGGRIEFKELSSNDKRNLYSLSSELVYATMAILITMSMFGGNEDKYLNFRQRMFWRFFNRFNGDLFYLYNFSNWKYLQENLIPLADIIISTGKFFVDAGYILASAFDPKFKAKAYYQIDTKLAPQGFPKALVDLTYVVPAGSAARYLLERIMKTRLKHKYVNYEKIAKEFGILDQVDWNSMDFKELEKLNMFDIQEYANRYDNFVFLVNRYNEEEAIKSKGISPATFFDLQTGSNQLKLVIDEYNKALKWLEIQKMLDNGELEFEKKKMKRAVKKYLRYKEKSNIRTKRKQERKYRKAIGSEKIKNLNQ